MVGRSEEIQSVGGNSKGSCFSGVEVLIHTYRDKAWAGGWGPEARRSGLGFGGVCVCVSPCDFVFSKHGISSCTFVSV